ncbi:MAG: type IX secretion system membrane protein PorP/SprF [Flavobacteriales bacterium]|nr:MAG: type IX secretion system membrane protein PorP/SprF [Flavobacteriales bacterium]
MKVFYKRAIVLIAVALINLMGNKLYAQLNPFGSSYFQRRYVNNPAYAGLSGELDISGAFKHQFSSIPGSPQMQNVTVEKGFNKSGVGLKFYNDKAGVLRYTTVSLTYAYHLQLDDSDKRLSFGLSGGFSDYNVDLSRVRGDAGDVELMAVDQRKTYFDGDFGIAYTSKTLSVEAAIPNMKQVFKKDLTNNADFALFYSAVSYRIQTNFGSLEPRAVYRGVNNYKDIFDVGLNVEFLPYADKQPLSLFGMYHSTNSFTAGAGVKINPNFGVSVMYTTSTSDLQGYNNGDFEIGIRVSPFAKKGGQ